MKKRYELDITNGTIADKVLMFTIPLMLSTLLQLLFNAADIVVVGRYVGPTALAAVGGNTTIINLFILVFKNMGAGVNVVTARLIGENRRDEVKNCVDTAIITGLYSGVFITVFSIVAIRPLLVLLKTPADVIDMMDLYLKLYFLGFPAIIIYNFGDAILKSKGDTSHSLYYIIAAGIINVILNLILVLVFDMGVAGVGIATTVSQYISAALVVRLLVKNDDLTHLDLGNMKFDKKIFMDFVKIGIPASVQSACFTLSNLVIISSINSFDNADLLAGSSTGNSIITFLNAMIVVFGITAMTFVSQNYGARKYDRVKKSILYCQVFGGLLSIVAGFGFAIFADLLGGLYAPGEMEVIRYSSIRVAVIGYTYLTYAIMETMVGTLRGFGRTLIPTLALIIGTCLLRVVYLSTVFRAVGTFESIMYSYPISWLITGAFLLIYYFTVRKKLYEPDELKETVAF